MKVPVYQQLVKEQIINNVVELDLIGSDDVDGHIHLVNSY